MPSDAGILVLGRPNPAAAQPTQSADVVGSFVRVGAAAGGIEQLGEREIECPEHGAYVSRGQKFMNTKSQMERWSACPKCMQEEMAATERDRRIADEAQHAERRERLLDRTAIPARFIGRTIDNFEVHCAGQASALEVARQYINEFDLIVRRGDSLVFSGGRGTGKNHLALAILQGILPRYVGMYATLMDLIRMVRDTWRRSSAKSEVEVFNALADLPLLVIDEIGVQYGTASEQTILFDVFDRRYRERKPTIMLTNLTRQVTDGHEMNEFELAVGERIYDRLRENSKWVTFNWDSYRPTARRELTQKQTKDDHEKN